MEACLWPCPWPEVTRSGDSWRQPGPHCRSRDFHCPRAVFSRAVSPNTSPPDLHSSNKPMPPTFPGRAGGVMPGIVAVSRIYSRAFQGERLGKTLRGSNSYSTRALAKGRRLPGLSPRQGSAATVPIPQMTPRSLGEWKSLLPASWPGGEALGPEARLAWGSRPPRRVPLCTRLYPYSAREPCSPAAPPRAAGPSAVHLRHPRAGPHREDVSQQPSTSHDGDY